jgi:hypothetical protein
MPAAAVAAVVVLSIGGVLLAAILLAAGAFGLFLVIRRRTAAPKYDEASMFSPRERSDADGLLPPPGGGIELVSGAKTYSSVNPLMAVADEVAAAMLEREKDGGLASRRRRVSLSSGRRKSLSIEVRFPDSASDQVLLTPKALMSPRSPSVSDRLVKLRVASRTLGKSPRLPTPARKSRLASTKEGTKEGTGGRTPPHLRGISKRDAKRAMKGSALMQFKAAAAKAEATKAGATNTSFGFASLKKLELLSIPSPETARRQSAALEKFRVGSRDVSRNTFSTKTIQNSLGATPMRRLKPLVALHSLSLSSLRPKIATKAQRPFSTKMAPTSAANPMNAARVAAAKARPRRTSMAPHLLSREVKRRASIVVQDNPLNRLPANLPANLPGAVEL